MLTGLALFAALTSCGRELPVTVFWGGVDPMDLPDPDQPSAPAVPPSNEDAVAYTDLHDPVRDAGQFFLPDDPVRPEVYWYLKFSDYANKEIPNSDGDENTGLQNFLLMQSVAGLVNRACAQGKTKVGVWIEAGGTGYDMERSELGRQITGSQTAIDLVTKTFGQWEGYDVTVRDLFDGYVLTDLMHNPESANVAAVASHVYNALIVDVRDEDFFRRNGYEKKFDCTATTLSQAFDLFKDRCRNDALVMMPVQTGELRDYAIQHELFVFNYNKRYNTTGGGRNSALLEEILEWLQPCSQVIGWEQGVGEHEFVDPVSRHGHFMLAADWSYNLGLTSRQYKKRQSSAIAKSINPRSIDYDKRANYLSFFLTDGDNYQWLITDSFVSDYYSLYSAPEVKMAFELGSQSLTQLAPTRFHYLLGRQPSAECTLMETFGGGYYYIDDWCTTGKNAARRAELLKTVAQRTAAHMRQHGIKILHVMARDFDSPQALEMLQAFVDANDQLEGITAVQYDPYTGGQGRILWLTNRQGYDIPCLTARYMLWSGLSEPDNLARTLQKDEQTSISYNAVAVHAWSSFNGRRSSDAAQHCAATLPEVFLCVSMQELIWRIRMAERKEQTLKYLATLK